MITGVIKDANKCFEINLISEKTKNPEILKTQHRKGRSSVIAEKPKCLTAKASVGGNRKSICIRPNSIQARRSSRSTYSLEANDFKRQVLQRCGQRRIQTFNSAYNEDYLKHCCKIGEGAFGEVFVYSNSKANHFDHDDVEKTVLKIIPIEGKQLINGEVQKTYEQILPEIIISMELSALSKGSHRQNTTSGFVNLQKVMKRAHYTFALAAIAKCIFFQVRCVKGKYPEHLQKLWEEYDLVKESENDHPKCFTSNQQYIVLELAFGGQDIESFCFKSAEQSFSALQQVRQTFQTE